MYQTKRQRITEALKIMLNQLRSKSSDCSKGLLVATLSLDLGVKESDIEEVLITFSNANIIEIKGDEILL